MEKEYTYSAFISYSSKDEKIAKSLWKKLERYRLPAVLQKQYEDIPEKMHIFLDQGDIVPGDTVENALSRELADSRKLIVICSPNSAVSPYVELEVKNFLSLGHSTNDIIPYIIDGEVDKNSPNNCYVPSLFGASDKDTLNGVSVIRDGKWKAFVGVLANLLDVKFDEIYKREKVRKNRITAAWSGLGFLIACFIGLVIWYVTPHTKYYMDYITKWGIPVGIYELNKRQVKQELEHYEITTQFGRPIRLVHANSRGMVEDQLYYLNHFNRPRVATYEYKNGILPFFDISKWNLSTVQFEYNSGDYFDMGINTYSMILKYDNNSKDCSTISFYYSKNNSLRKFISNDFLASESFYFSDITSLIVNTELHEELEIEYPEVYFIEGTSSICQFRINYDDLGYESYISFYNYNDSVVCDKNGINGINQVFDNQGRIIKQFFTFDSPNLNNIPSAIKYEYDVNGKLVFMGYMGYSESSAENDLRLNNDKRGFSYYKTKYEDNKIKISYYDNKNNYSDNKKLGFSIEEMTTRDGLEVYTKCFSIGKKQNCISEVEHDVYGNISYIKTTMLSDKNIIKSIKEAFYTYEGNKIKEWKSTEEDFLTNEKTSVRNVLDYIIDETGLKIIRKNEANELPNLEEETHFDNLGRRIKEKIVYPDGDYFSGEIVYGGDNRSITYKKNGEYYTPHWNKYAQGNFRYDNNNHLIACDFKNENNEYVCASIGFAKYEAKYSVLGEKIFEVFKNENDFYVAYKGYTCMQAKESMDHKYLENVKYYDEYGAVIINIDTIKESDDRRYTNIYTNGNLKQIRYYKNDKLDYVSVYDKINGNNLVRSDYDIYSRLIGDYLYDEKNELIMQDVEYPYAYFRIEYTNDGVSKYFYGLQDELLTKFIKKSNGYSEDYMYYENGNIRNKRITNKDVLEEFYIYYENGTIKGSIKNTENGKEKIRYYQNGICQYKIIERKDGIEEAFYYFEDGTLKQKIITD